MIPNNSLKRYWDNLPVWLFLFLIFLLPFFHKYSNVVMGVLLVVSIIEIIRIKKIQAFRVFWFLPTLFFYYAISEWLSGGLWFSMERRILLIAIPLVFALNPSFYQAVLKNKIYLSFIIGNLVAVIACFVRATVRSISIAGGHLAFNPKVDGADDLLSSSVMGGNYYFGYEFSFFLPTPTYFGIFIVFAQYLIFELAKSPGSKKKTSWLISCYFLFELALFLLSSKAAIITSLLLSFYIAYYVLSTLRIGGFARFAIIAGTITVSILVLLYNPRLQVFTETFKKGELINPNARFGDDLRILSWNASLELIKDNWLIGVGEGKKESRLNEVYVKKGYTYPAEKMLNSHNQYLDFLIGGGILGFVLFMAGLIQLLIISIKNSDKILLAFLFIFCFNALFENLLSRHAGMLFFALFVTLMSGVDGKKTP